MCSRRASLGTRHDFCAVLMLQSQHGIDTNRCYQKQESRAEIQGILLHKDLCASNSRAMPGCEDEGSVRVNDGSSNFRSEQYGSCSWHKSRLLIVVAFPLSKQGDITRIQSGGSEIELDGFVRGIWQEFYNLLQISTSVRFGCQTFARQNWNSVCYTGLEACDCKKDSCVFASSTFGMSSDSDNQSR